MIAIVMCGGRGSRLGFVEKPMIEVNGVKLIDFAVDEISLAELEGIFVTSPYTRETERYLRSIGAEVHRGKGKGYMEDLSEAVREFGLVEPVLTLNADLYYFRRGVVRDVLTAYLKTSSRALKTAYENGRLVGINVFDPFFGEQEEETYIIRRDEVLNIDTPDDLRELKWTSFSRRGGDS